MEPLTGPEALTYLRFVEQCAGKPEHMVKPGQLATNMPVALRRYYLRRLAAKGWVRPLRKRRSRYWPVPGAPGIVR